MKPILFSTPMVQAILAGRKTMTRRIVKPQPAHEVVNIWTDTQDPIQYHFQSPHAGTPCDGIHVSGTVAKPRYERGDILWVRETMYFDDVDQSCYYKADYTDREIKDLFKDLELKATPSIYMEKQYARIFLKVTTVWVERLQDISYEDCLAEGMHDFGTEVDTLGAFQELWQSINAKRGFGWDVNPWVWVISFKKTEVGNGH